MGSTKRFFWNIIASGLSTDHDIEVLRKIVLLNLLIILGSFFLSLLGTIAFFEADYLLGLIDLTIALFIIGLAIYLRRKKNHYLVSLVGTITIGIFYSFLIAYGGGSNTTYVWLFTYPLISLFLLGSKLGSVMSFLLLGMAAVVFTLSANFAFLASYSLDLKIRFIPAYMTVYLFSYIMEKIRSIVHNRLKSTNLTIEKAFEEIQERTVQLAESNQELQDEISERKRIEKALRDSESFLEDVIESIQDGISVLSSDLTIRHVNSVMEKWYKDNMPLVGKKCFNCYHNHDRPCNPCPSMRALQSGRTESDLVPGKPGSPIEWLELFSFPIIDREKGEITGVVEFVRDITERKKVRQLQARLQQAEKMEAIGTLAGGVAHDLNNVLSGIVSYPDLLLMQIEDDSPLRKPLVTIQNSGKKAAAIVQDLLTLARRGVAVNEVINLNAIINDYFKSPELERLKSFHTNIHINVNLEPDLLNIKGSAIHLSKTIMNLVSNAAEAMPDGGEITITTENRYVDTPPTRGNSDLKEGDYIVLSVADTGVGIHPNDRKRIFEPFYTKKKMGRSGTGLGMAVVWGAVKDHKGFIDIRGAEVKGTMITIYLPVTREILPVNDSTPSIDVYRGQGESILVIDDVKEQREIASGLLNELGYTVSSVSSGEEAIAYMQANSADLLLLDMIMTGFDGLETYQRILEKHPNQKAIIASGYSETNRVKMVQRLGAGQYLKKPYTLENIGLAVKQELEK